MARKSGRDKCKLLAKLVTENRAPCAFCQREVDDEVTYGKLYAIGNIQCHYFCVLLSCCLVQKGKDSDGLFGFLYSDILAELERSKKHRCSYCSKGGATLGCCVSQCRKQFHLPCGRERNAVSLFYGNYKSFCQLHAPKQSIAAPIMAKAKARMLEKKKKLRHPNKDVQKKTSDDLWNVDSVCVICYEEVECFPTAQTFWPPCCARDAWFHRNCLQRMALSAGIHYLKCPLCNDKEDFYQAVVSHGYYVPDRDAAWELEQNAFAEIYERPLRCEQAECLCPLGRDHDQESGPWDVQLCLLCGSAGAHAACLQAPRLVCRACLPAAPAPADLARLARTLDAVIQQEQESRRATSRRGRVMPSRMSLRRTKQRIAYNAASSSSSQNDPQASAQSEKTPSDHTITSRQALNLTTPKRGAAEANVLQDIENTLLSPIKLVQLGLRERARASGASGTENMVVDAVVAHRLRQTFSKPKPLCEKKRIVEGIVEDLFNHMTKENVKVKEPVKEWNSPKKQVIELDNNNAQLDMKNIKQEIEDHPDVIDPNANGSDDSNSTFQLPSEFVAEHNSDDSLPIFDTPKKRTTIEIQKDSSMEISENNDTINIDLVQIENQKAVFLENFNLRAPLKDTCALKFSPKDKETLEHGNIEMDIESFKNQYLTEVDRDFKCKYEHKHTDATSGGSKLETAINLADDVKTKKGNRKRKMIRKKPAGKKMKMSNFVLKYEDAESNARKKVRKKHRTKVSITNDKVKVKISLKKEKVRLRITQTEAPKLKQYVLKYADGSSKELIEKPDREVSPIKRKYVKQEKSPDKLVQTSIHSFFKSKSPKE